MLFVGRKLDLSVLSPCVHIPTIWEGTASYMYLVRVQDAMELPYKYSTVDPMDLNDSFEATASLGLAALSCLFWALLSASRAVLPCQRSRRSP